MGGVLRRHHLQRRPRLPVLPGPRRRAPGGRQPRHADTRQDLAARGGHPEPRGGGFEHDQVARGAPSRQGRLDVCLQPGHAAEQSRILQLLHSLRALPLQGQGPLLLGLLPARRRHAAHHTGRQRQLPVLLCRLVPDAHAARPSLLDGALYGPRRADQHLRDGDQLLPGHQGQAGQRDRRDQYQPLHHLAVTDHLQHKALSQLLQHHDRPRRHLLRTPRHHEDYPPHHLHRDDGLRKLQRIRQPPR